MWILLNNSFLSIVEHRSSRKLLLVRARVKGDIERIFKSAEVTENGGTDYQYRALLPREVVQAAIMREISGIHYPNFKSSVLERFRHDAYMNVWTSLYESFRGR
jgi:hypothetical protein